MPFNLPAIARQRGVRRDITLRPIFTTKAQASDLAALYIPVVRVWQDAIPRILAGYDPAPLGDALTTDSVTGMRQAIDAADNEVSRLVITITGQIRDWAARIERYHRGKWIGAVLTATSVDLGTVLTALPVQETLEAFLERNVALVKDVSAQTRGRISETVFREYQRRTPIRKVAKQLDETTGLGRKRARRIAQDQTVKLAAALDHERQVEAGVEQFKWRHSGKRHPREDHVARNGKVYDWSKPPADTPGELPYCGCVAQAYLPMMEEFGL
jgi:SPP1 gp7 family putative phage head morphogenesis protein